MRFPWRSAAAIGLSAAIPCAVAMAYSAEANTWWPDAVAMGPPPNRPHRPAQFAVRQDPLPIRLVADAGRYRDGVATGPAFSAYYGEVQVQAVIRGGRIEEVRILRQPSHYATSRSINRRALPRLQREAIQAQSAYVHAVSGATLTSHAFIRSMEAALRHARG